MKNILALAFALLTLSAYDGGAVSKFHTDYKFFSASFGTDGASKEAYPNSNSTNDAKALYEGMITQNFTGEKFVGLTIEGERYGLSCEEPTNRITTESASCIFTGLSRKSSQETETGIYIDEDIKFGGALAKTLVANMSLEKDDTRIGFVTYKLANLTCVETVEMGFIECTLSHTVVKAMDLDFLIRIGLTTKVKADKIVNVLGY